MNVGQKGGGQGGNKGMESGSDRGVLEGHVGQKGKCGTWNEGRTEWQRGWMAGGVGQEEGEWD